MATSPCEGKSRRTLLQVTETEATLLPALATFQPGLPGLSDTVLDHRHLVDISQGALPEVRL